MTHKKVCKIKSTTEYELSFSTAEVERISVFFVHFSLHKVRIFSLRFLFSKTHPTTSERLENVKIFSKT